MSRIRQRTQDIVRRGHENRGTWSPKVGGAPLKRYQWWCRETDTYRQQENFCHYWRVVLVWAPLLKLRRTLTPAKSWQPEEILLIVFVSYMIILTAWVTVVAWSDVGAWALLVGPLMVIAGLASVATFIMALMGIAQLVEYFRCRAGKRPDKSAKQQTVEVAEPAVEATPEPRRPVSERPIGRLAMRVLRLVGHIGEYAVLVAQVVRVKKWRICPIVDIPTTESD